MELQRVYPTHLASSQLSDSLIVLSLVGSRERSTVHFRPADYVGRLSRERPRIISLFLFTSVPADYVGRLSRERPRIISLFLFTSVSADYVGRLSRERPRIIFVGLFHRFVIPTSVGVSLQSFHASSLSITALSAGFQLYQLQFEPLRLCQLRESFSLFVQRLTGSDKTAKLFTLAQRHASSLSSLTAFVSWISTLPAAQFVQPLRLCQLDLAAQAAQFVQPYCSVSWTFTLSHPVCSLTAFPGLSTSCPVCQALPFHQLDSTLTVFVHLSSLTALSAGSSDLSASSLPSSTVPSAGVLTVPYARSLTFHCPVPPAGIIPRKFNSAKKKKADKLLRSERRKSEALNRFESHQAARNAVAITDASAVTFADQEQQRTPRPRLSDFVPPPNPRKDSFHPYEPWPCSTVVEQPTPPGSPEPEERDFIPNLSDCEVMDEVGPSSEDEAPSPGQVPSSPPKRLVRLRNTKTNETRFVGLSELFRPSPQDRIVRHKFY
ncbi:hypothetical protein OUZ56_009584 [Daphnia magna]|uniref:Uncharacterized protein n=1 Tax=Daphnia magna TaxID=35525 RepID=A0ABR0AGE8_9CRUS|nr:hypothetical protein OUZ56_009584 [Daphnia magna]